MKYRLINKEECDEAFRYLTELVAKEAIAEVKKVQPRRTGQQNKYLHVIIGYFGLETGYTLAEAKTLYKREVNPDIYVYSKKDKQFLRSSADLNEEEMSKSIDRFIKYAGEAGIELPLADNTELLRYMENRIEQEGKNYL